MVYELARHLPKSKVNAVILQPKKIRALEEKPFPDDMVEDIEIINFPCSFVPKIDYTLPLFHKELEILTRLSKERDLDLIQVADYFYPTAIAPICIKRRYGTPILLTVNALPGYSWHFGDSFIDSVARIYTHSIGKPILCSFDRVVALYRKISKEIEMLGVPPDRVSVIPNGVDLREFDRAPDKTEPIDNLLVKDGEIILLFVGRLAKVKRVDILISITKMLIQEGYRVRTIIVGEGPMRNYYERLSRAFRENIIFSGYVPKKRLPEFYHMADVFVLPSFSEGLPNVLLEASAAGKPCVASGVNGVFDIIKHGKTGFLVGNPSPSSYYSYVKMLLEDRQLRARIGRNARENVERNFSWKTIVRKYINMYEDTLHET